MTTADAMEGEWDEDFESSEDGTEQESEDEDLSKADVHVHQRQNSDFFFISTTRQEIHSRRLRVDSR